MQRGATWNSGLTSSFVIIYGIIYNSLWLKYGINEQIRTRLLKHLQIKKVVGGGGGGGGGGAGTAASSSTRESGCTAAAPA
ncbi:hypothetical protein ACJX0J_041361, partial [Zea mays]